MTTLISVYHRGACVGRCDAHCYNAKTPPSDCDCICNGANHGAGQERATQNVLEYTEERLKELRTKGAVIPTEVRLEEPRFKNSQGRLL